MAQRRREWSWPILRCGIGVKSGPTSRDVFALVIDLSNWMHTAAPLQASHLTYPHSLQASKQDPMHRVRSSETE